MKNLFAIPLLLFAAFSASGQANLTQTTLGTAINNNIQTFPLGAYTNITGGTTPTMLFVDRESMLVLNVTATNVTVARGQTGTQAVAHINGAMVLAGPPNYFFSKGPLSAACTASTILVTPLVDSMSGLQWLCSSILGKWVPGWQNISFPAQVTAAVASAAGLITPSGPLFHVTGTAAITGFNIPLGFEYGSFTIIPDAIFTTTTANNIALGSTAVVNKLLTFTWDGTAKKFVPSY